jgi:DegV family protein with EDD domain
MVKIITDTTSVLPQEIALRYQITIIPQVINFEEETYYEGIDIDIYTFMDRLRKAKTLPKTAAPPPELFIKEFEKALLSTDSILCIHPSSEVSGTVNSAMVAAKDFPQADIRVIDTRMIASPLATMVELAAEWAEAGVNVDEIEKRLYNLIPNCRIYFLVATLEYLARGGRIGGAAALLGSVLQIKPILTLKDGKVDVFERERTHKRAISRIKEIVKNELPPRNGRYLTIMQADALDQAKSLAEELETIHNIPHIPIYNMPPAIVTHGGPGILGVGFFIGQMP